MTPLSWEEWRHQGRGEARQEVLRNQVRFKFGEISSVLERCIVEASLPVLDEYLERVLHATSIADLLPRDTSPSSFVPLPLYWYPRYPSTKPRELDPTEILFLKAMRKASEYWRKKGKCQGRQETLQRQIICKFGAIPSELEQRIAEASIAQLDRYLERVLVATSITDVFARGRRARRHGGS